jgi:hypothetical protein
MADSRCVHLMNNHRKAADGVAFIRLKVAGSKQMVQLCVECHGALAGGEERDVKFSNSGRNRIRPARRFPRVVERVWFEIQLI